MSPLPSGEKRPIRAVGARRIRPGSPSAKELVAQVRAAAKPDGALVALLDARGVAGERHLLSAWAHLGRARQRGEGRLRDRGAEFLLFVAGDDQLPRALSKVGVQEDTEGFVVVTEPPGEPGAWLAAWGLQEDPSVYPRPPGRTLLDRLGVAEEERSVVPEAAWEGLVLERVALLELSAPKPSEPTAPSAQADGSERPPRKAS